MSFADAEARVTASTISRLSNATATISLPADVAGETLDGIFDSAYQVIDQGTGVQSAQPAFGVQDVDMPDAMAAALEAGDDVALEIRGDTYTVVEPQPDGAGFTVLRLRK